MKKLLILAFVLIFSLSALFAFEMTNYVAVEAEYSAIDVKDSKGAIGANVTGEFAFCTDEMSRLFYPFGLFGIGFQLDFSEESIELLNEGINLKFGGGALYRIKNNFYAFDDAEAVLLMQTSSKNDNSKFAFKELGGRIGVQLSNGSVGIKGGAFVGYSFVEEKGFVFRPFVSGLIGVGGNKVTKYDSKTGEVNRDNVIANDITVASAGLAFTKLPNTDEEKTAFTVSADCSRDWYFRFDAPERRVAPLAGFSAGIGAGTMGLTLNANAYGGAGFKVTDSVYANLALGAGGQLGFLKGFNKASDEGKILLTYFGWIIPNGYQGQIFIAPSVTYVSPNSGFGVKAGCDVGLTTWANAFAWGKKVNDSKEEGKGLYLRAYVSLALDDEKIFSRNK